MSVVKTKIGEILIEKGVVTRDCFLKALEIQRSEPVSTRRKIGNILIDEFNIERDLVYTEIAQIYGFKKVVINGFKPPQEQVEFIKGLIDKLNREDKNRLVKRRILPFKLGGSQKDILILLAADPTDICIPDLSLQFGYNRFEVAYSSPDDIDKLISIIAPLKNEFLQILEEMNDEIDVPTEEEDSIDEEALDVEINQSKLTNLVEGVLVEAVRKGASDIHIVPRGLNRVEILFRIDGKLQMWNVQENSRAEAVTAVFKDRAKNVDRFERDSAQDGFIQRKIDNYTIRFRVSILPFVGNEFDKKFESIVIRILDDRKVITDLDRLGLQNKAKEDFIKAISRPQGITILTGPTGSGKSTTLVAALNYVMDPSLNVLTVEDPVEYLIKGARQLKINPKMNFDQALRSILRHDPDIVMVGEMRDLKSAEIAVKLANTGHLTFSTLHTNDAPSAISRLYKMGVETFLIANAINIVIAQRLLRTLCPKCKAKDPNPDQYELKTLGFTEEEIANTTFYKPVGCSDCNKGYKGRTAIHEALLFTKDIRRIILQAQDAIDEDSVRQQAIKNGMLTLRLSGKERVKQQLTTCREVLTITSDDDF